MENRGKPLVLLDVLGEVLAGLGLQVPVHVNVVHRGADILEQRLEAELDSTVVTLEPVFSPEQIIIFEVQGKNEELGREADRESKITFIFRVCSYILISL